MRVTCGLLLAGVGLLANAAELKDCVKLVVNADGAASLTNACGNRLNMIYCIANDSSARSCGKTPQGVTTLSPGAAERLPAYTAEGAGAVHWAVCVYPEAPVGWKPGPESAYTCRKTCVMC